MINVIVFPTFVTRSIPSHLVNSYQLRLSEKMEEVNPFKETFLLTFLLLQGPLNGSRTPEINSNQSESVGGGHLGSISGVLGTFGGLWGAPKPN